MTSTILIIALSILLILCLAYLVHLKKFAKIAETKLANSTQALTEAEEKYKVLTDNLAAAVIIRGLDGKVLYCSPFTEVVTGYSTKEIYAATGDFFESTVHDEDREKYRRSLKVSSFGEAFQFRYRFFHKSGILMWAESRTVPILDDRGSAVSSLSIALDVTGTVRYQRQVEEKNRELQDFTYMVSHDLKAPIFTIKGMLGILEEDFAKALPPDAQEPLEHLKRATHRLEQLVGSVLEYSRASAFETKDESVDLGELIREVSKDYELQLAKVGGSISVVQPLPTVMGDRLKLIQVFSNLISNSIKYHSPKRKLLIEVLALPTTRVRSVKVEIRDNGEGIPPDKTESIFRPFQRLHGAEIEGTGIGLACVKKLVEKMGGDVVSQSDGANGSSFFLTFRHGV